MRYFLIFLISISIVLVLKPIAVLSEANDINQKNALKINIAGAIGPATQDYVEQSIEKAVKEKSEFLIIQLDTPGGLDTAMRGIIQAILSSPIPVISYVAPSGARAASAGTYIVYASHIAAMAPGTNIGAASPVSIGGIPSPDSTDNKKKGSESESVMEKKVKQDASAYIKSLAAMRGRNANWAEQAVEKAVSISAIDAYKLNVIDLIADDMDDLLKKINGRSVKLVNKTVTINTDNIAVTTFEPDWRNHFLSILTDPNIAYILMLIGIYGLFFEFSAPGFILPGVIGAISLILALYAFQLLPINYAGFGLLILGIVFMILEGYSPTFGALGVGGIIAFVVGSIFLLEPNVAGYSIAWSVILLMTLLTTAFFITILSLAIRSHRRKVVTGSAAIIAQEGIVIANQEQLLVRIKGEIWKVNSSEKLKIGQKVRVTKIDGLSLYVEPLGD